MRECDNNMLQAFREWRDKGVGMIRKFNNGGGTLIGVLKDMQTLPTLHTHFLIITHSNEHGTFKEQ